MLKQKFWRLLQRASMQFTWARTHSLGSCAQSSAADILPLNEPLNTLDSFTLDRHSINSFTVEDLKKIYFDQKKIVFGCEVCYEPSDTHAVFANNEISLRHIDVYGFDYDYTLAHYDDELQKIIYDMALNNLIAKYGYPESIRSLRFDAGFPIRGLHFDTQKGYMMKLDSFSHVQLDTVYRGLELVPDWDVIKNYHGTLIGVDTISRGIKKEGTTIHQQMDLFSIPVLSLLANMIQHLTEQNVTFDPEYVYQDVENATRDIHVSGLMHAAILKDLDRFLPRNSGLSSYLNRLKTGGKKLFIITNSGFKFVDRGMQHLIGPDWLDLFDVVVTNSRKPKFFSEKQRPFRSVDPLTGLRTWDQVFMFQNHGVYCEGNIHQFMKFTGYEGPNVLYFGDHVYSDLMDPVLRHGWRTGAIIPELEREIKLCHAPEYINNVRWLLSLEELIAAVQFHSDDETKELLLAWKGERKETRKALKVAFNPYFGSMFRTYHNQTFFSRRLTRYADVYTSSVENLLHYGLTYTFYPRRNALPHELAFYKR